MLLRAPLRRRLAVSLALIAWHVAGNGQESEAIPWRADRPLTWSDFRAPVDPDAGPRTAASTSASLGFGYRVQVRRNGRCVFEITSVDTRALFHPDESWVRPDARTQEILEHEQGHFDLTQIHRMMLEREARELVGDERECSPDADIAAIEARAADIANRVRDRIWEDLERVQAQYDAETAHGTLREAQREWTGRIREALRRGGW